MAAKDLTMDKIEESIAIKLYLQLEKLFGHGNQAFCMEYPTRNLNARDYAYTIEDNTGVLFKPQTVAEAEFNLSDNVIELAPIVQGSTGERVSNLYKSILNNYIPRLHYAARLASEKGRLKSWLLEPIKGTVLDYDKGEDKFFPSDFEGTRMEYSARLYRTYLYKRQAFNEEVNAKKKEAKMASNINQAGIDFADWLSTVAATDEEILSTFYNDAVVRGNLHEVNSAISFLDIPSLGQRLNEIKRDLRSNVKRSVIGGGDVYTVNFSPSNWFESLTLAPSPIDVVTNASYRENLIQSKSNELNNARQQLSSLQNINVDKDKQEGLEQKIKDLNNEIDAAYIEVRKQFQERLVTAVQFAQEALAKTAEFAMAAYTGGVGAAFTSRVAELAQKKARTTDSKEISHIGKIAEQTKGTLQSFVRLDRARQESVELRSKLALAKSSDYASQIKMLQHQINKLSEELKALESEDALYPSSMEQLKNDIYYAAEEKQSGEQGKDAKIQEDVKKLKELEQSLGSNVDTEAAKKEALAKAMGDAKKDLADTKINEEAVTFADGLTQEAFEKKLEEIIVGSDKASQKKAKKIQADFNEAIENLDKQAKASEHAIISKVTSLAKRLGVGEPLDEKDDYYQTIIVEMDCSESESHEDSSSSASSSGKSHDYWFSSGSSSSSQSSSHTSVLSEHKDLKITLKLRATKVTIERGGWFGVDILRLTEGMFHVDPNLKAATGDELSLFESKGKVNSPGKFTHYPMSFIIVKDVEITKSSSTSFARHEQSDYSSTTSSRKDGWFSSKHKESSQQSHHEEGEDQQKRFFETTSLPNPAIIGWFQQVVPKDESLEYAKTQEKKEEFSQTITQFLESIVFK